jgi:hypothetical protein
MSDFINRVGQGSRDWRGRKGYFTDSKEPPLPGPLLHKFVEERERTLVILGFGVDLRPGRGLSLSGEKKQRMR